MCLGTQHFVSPYYTLNPEDRIYGPQIAPLVEVSSWPNRLMVDRYKDSLVWENYYVSETSDFFYFNPAQCSYRIVEQWGEA